MKHMALGTVKYPDDCSVDSGHVSQHIYHIVYLSSKGPSDCAIDTEGRQTVDGGEVDHMIQNDLFLFSFLR